MHFLDELRRAAAEATASVGSGQGDVATEQPPAASEPAAGFQGPEGSERALAAGEPAALSPRPDLGASPTAPLSAGTPSAAAAGTGSAAIEQLHSRATVDAQPAAPRPKGLADRGPDYTSAIPAPAHQPVPPSGSVAMAPAGGAGVREVRAARSGGPRRARLALRRLDPWSTCKTAFVFSLGLAVVLTTAIAVLWLVLDRAGVFGSVNDALRNVKESYHVDFSGGTVIGGGAVISFAAAVILTALATLAAFLYNLCAEVSGGVEVTLVESD